MNRQMLNLRLHMGCGESLNREARKDQRRKVNQQSDGVSIPTPVVTKRNSLRSGR